MATSNKRSPAQIRALGAFTSVMRAAQVLDAALGQELAASRLSHSQFEVLNALRRGGPLPQRELCSRVLCSPANISLLVDQLEFRGLVRRERSSEDRRVILVGITKEGKTLFDAVFPGHLRDVIALLERLAPAEQEELSRICGKLCGDGAE